MNKNWLSKRPKHGKSAILNRCLRINVCGVFFLTVTADRKKMVTTIKFKRPLQTNEPINDMAIPTDGYVSVIGAIGTLNSRREANAHTHDGMNVNSEDIRIDFSSKVLLYAPYIHSFMNESFRLF